MSNNEYNKQDSNMSWAALAAAGLTAAGSVANNLVGSAQSKKQRKWSEQMMDKQNAFAVDMWNKSNVYESPAEQRKRLLDAGINPLSQDMGNMSAGDLTSASPNAYSLPSLNNPMQDAIGSFLSVKQATNIDADTEQKYAETARLKGLTPHEVKEAEERANKAHQEVLKLMSDRKLTDEQYNGLKIENAWIDRRQEAELNKIVADTNVQNAVKQLTDKEREQVEYNLNNLLPLDKDIKEWNISEIKERIEQIKASTKLTNEDIINYALNHEPETMKMITTSIQALSRLAKKNGDNSELSQALIALSDAFGLDTSDVPDKRKRRGVNTPSTPPEYPTSSFGVR